MKTVSWGRPTSSLFIKNKVVRCTTPGEFSHSNVGGPIETQSLVVCKFYVLFKDDASSYRRVYAIRNKSDVYEKAVEFIREVSNKFNRASKTLFSDRKKE